MITQDSKTKFIPRDLSAITIVDSLLWRQLQWLISIVFCNLILFAFIPYLFLLPLSVFFALGILINLIFLCIWRFKPFVPKKYEIACKHGIWKLMDSGKLHYSRPMGEIIMWQWIIIIRLYDAAQKRIFTLVILKDSLSPQDNARLRRWLVSEFI